MSPLTPFGNALFGDDLLISCRMSGRRVTIPVPRGRLYGQYVNSARVHDGVLVERMRTNLSQRCFPGRSFSRWTESLQPLFVGDLLDFVPVELLSVAGR